MPRFVLFLHVLGAVSIGFYLLLPLVTAKLKGLSPQGQVGFAKVIFGMNRVGQWLLILQFLTGGYMISHSGVSVPWIIVTIVLFLAMGAMVGMLGAPLRRMIAGGDEGKEAAAKDVSKLTMFSGISAVLLVLLVILMYYSNLI